MKKISVLILIISLFASCGSELERQDRKRMREKKKALKEQVNDKTYIQPSIEELEKELHVTYKTVATDSSYWYLILTDKRENGDIITWHGVAYLPTPYFDFVEARKEFDGATGKIFFKTIIQITKESAESYVKYSENN